METSYQNLPKTPGVYLMKNAVGEILYVGKAANLRRRVASYFMRAHDLRMEKLVSEIKKIDYKKTDTAIEALILEAELIKKYKPPFNIREKDDKSFLYVEITDDEFPRVLLARGKDSVSGKRYGPFISASNIREAIKILRRIFQWSTHATASIVPKSGKSKRLCPEQSRRACFDYEIGLCPGTCIGAIDRKSYLKNIRNLELFFEGKKNVVLRNLSEEMSAAAKKLDFEKAEKLRRKIFALKHIQDTALISDSAPLPTTHHTPHTRIEGYDISNISGTSAVGSMVVFSAKGGSASGGNGLLPDKNEYRKFKIRTIFQPNDVAMLKEVLVRRFNRQDWPMPDLILIDGGSGQVNAAKQVLGESGLKIPVVGIAKGSKRKKNEFIGLIPTGVSKQTLIRVRDEAHRFAISYHKKLRSGALYSK